MQVQYEVHVLWIPGILRSVRAIGQLDTDIVEPSSFTATWGSRTTRLLSNQHSNARVLLLGSSPTRRQRKGGFDCLGEIMYGVYVKPCLRW